MVTIVILTMTVKVKVENLTIIARRHGFFMLNKLVILHIIIVCNKLLLQGKETSKMTNQQLLRVD